MNTNKKVVIIGAGISTHIFLNEVKNRNLNYNITVLEKKSYQEIIDEYDDVPFYFNKEIPSLNVDFEKIVVKMRIYDNNILYDHGTDEFSEKYSKKILGRKSGNTIKFLEKNKNAFVIRDNDKVGRKMLLQNILIERNKNNNFLYDNEVKSINLKDKVITLENGNSINYDILISTIPLNYLMNLTENKIIDLFYKPFNIIKIYGLEDIDYKVAYCTDANIRINRIARLGNTIFIESPNKLSLSEMNAEENKFIDMFISKDNLKKYKNKSYQIFPGRFSQLNNNDYQKVEDFFLKYNVFLLERMATWRFKLVEDVLEDSRKILNILEIKNDD